MTLEKTWIELEGGEPLTTSEEKRFADDIARGMDALISALREIR